MAIGMLKRAAKDLESTKSTRRQSAYRWIQGDASDTLSARWCCSIVGVSIEKLRCHAEEHVQQTHFG